MGAHASTQSPAIRTRPVAAWALASVAFLLVACAYAYYVIFSRKVADDEGYLMISVQGFLGGHPLYDDLFTQYGPLYYFYEWIIHAALGVPLTHDTTRLICIAHWVGASLVLGVAGGLLTRSALGGFFVFVQAVMHLTMMANEPGHPQEVVALLLAAGLLIAASPCRPPAVLAALAGIGAALACIKINVGVFFGFALVLGLWCTGLSRVKGSHPLPTVPGQGAGDRRRVIGGKSGFTSASARRGGNVLLWAITGACVGMPLWLMRRYLSEAWCLNYALAAISAMVTTVWIGRCVSDQQPTGLQPYLFVGACFALTGAVICGVALAQGSSMHGLLDGLILRPLRLPLIALLPMPLAGPVIGNAVLSIMVAVALILTPSAGAWRIAVPGLKIVYAVTGALCLVQDVNLQLGYLLPWTWLVLVPWAAGATLGSRESFGRVFLGVAAAWQGLQAYPIGGTQVALATLLLVVCYTVCGSDALRAAAGWEWAHRETSRLAPRTQGLVCALTVVALLFLFTDGWCRPGELRREYSQLKPLALPGSERVRLSPDWAQRYQELTKYLAEESDTFITYPGYNSLYFWTGKRPPTQLNSTGWGLLTIAEQERILAGLKAAKRPLVVVHEYAMRGWGTDTPVEIGPLVRLVKQGCREVKRIGPFVIYVPTQAGDASERNR